MSIVLGVLLAGGMLLTASPWLFPARETEPARVIPSALARLAEEAGFAHVRPRIVVIVSAFAALIAGSIAWLVLAVPVLAAVAACAGGLAPVLWLRRRRARLARMRRGLWPDVCDHLIASVRAGMSLPDAVASLGASAPGPLRPAFFAFAGDYAASGHFDSSVQQLKAALADPVADRIIEALRMARHVGGTELTPVLRALGVSVRADAALRGEVEARQSWIRGAAVLGVVAPWAILALLSLRPEGARAYTSPEGLMVIVVGGAISLISYRLMVRIGRLPEPRRSFG